VRCLYGAAKKIPPIYSGPQDNEPCYVISDEPVQGWVYKGPTLAHRTADFDPTNNNQFVCIESEEDTVYFQRLIVYNMLTHQKRILVTGSFLDQPHWGSKGWIVFTSAYDDQLWMVKSDASQLVQLTKDPAGSLHDFPAWSPDGTKIILAYNPPNGAPGFSRIIDTNGNVLRNLDTSFGGDATWFPDGGHISGINHGKAHILDLGSNKMTPIPYEVKALFPDEQSWISRDLGGIFVYHQKTNSRQLIKPLCTTREYNYFSISNDGQQILTSWRISKQLDSQTLWTEEDIVTMDANGNNVKVVDIK